MTEKKPAPKKTTVEKAAIEKDARQIMAERKTRQPKDDKVKTVPKKASWSLRILLVVMIFILIFILGSGAGIYFLPALKDRIPPLARWIGEPAITQAEDPLLNRKIAALEERLAQQGNDIARLKTAKERIDQQLSNLPAATTTTDPVILERLDRLEQARLVAENNTDDISRSARIDMLLSRMSQLEAAFVPLSKGLSDAQTARQERSQILETMLSHREKLDQMESRLDRVEQYAARDNSGTLLAFRIGELRRKVTSGQAFGPEIEAVKTMIAKGSLAQNNRLNESISWLGQHKDGLTTRDKIRDRFNDLIPALIRSENTRADDPWWKRAYNSSRNLVMVRKTSDADTQSLDDVLARARQMLARYDLEDALDQLKQLPGNMREILDVWIMQAEIYLRAIRELDNIESLTAAYYLAGKTQDVSEEEAQ